MEVFENDLFYSLRDLQWLMVHILNPKVHRYFKYDGVNRCLNGIFILLKWQTLITLLLFINY